MSKTIIPPFTRVGGKSRLKKQILPLIDGVEHDIYVEPFIGGGVIYLNKQKSRVEVINDKDTDLINAWKALKKPTKVNLNKYDTRDFDILTQYYYSTPRSGIPLLVKEIVRSKNSFAGQGKGKIIDRKKTNPRTNGNKHLNFNPFTILKKKKQYEERLKTTLILNQNYATVIKKFDSADTLFYLDPPYESSNGLYKHHEFNFANLHKILKKIKGRFLLSTNDSENIRGIFKDFNITPITLSSTTSLINRGGIYKRKELLISNYKIK